MRLLGLLIEGKRHGKIKREPIGASYRRGEGLEK
jgi:hypothetical protein